MVVLMPNTQLGVRRRQEPMLDAHGTRVTVGYDADAGPWPGRAREEADGTWRLGIDPLGWPVRVDDIVWAADGREWLVTAAQLLQNNLDHRVDWVRCTGYERKAGGTEPGGADFVGR